MALGGNNSDCGSTLLLLAGSFWINAMGAPIGSIFVAGLYSSPHRGDVCLGASPVSGRSWHR